MTNPLIRSGNMLTPEQGHLAILECLAYDLAARWTRADDVRAENQLNSLKWIIHQYKELHASKEKDTSASRSSC